MSIELEFSLEDFRRLESVAAENSKGALTTVEWARRALLYAIKVNEVDSIVMKGVERMKKAGLLLSMLALLLLPTCSYADTFRVGKHITTQTTTNLVAAVAGKHVTLLNAMVCVDVGGAAAGVAFTATTSGTNIFGTGGVWTIAAGSCLSFPVRPGGPGAFYGSPTATGLGLDIITSVGNGPLEVIVEASQQ